MSRRGWGFDTRNMDANVRPQDDFYRYANGGWLKRAKIPADESYWGSFTMLHHKTEKQLRALLKKLETKRVAQGSPEQLIRDLYRSSLDLSRRKALGAAPLLPYQRKIRAISSREELLDVIALFHRIGIGAFWEMLVDQDQKNSSRYILYMRQDGLGMPDRDYYLKNAPEQKRVRRAYAPHIEAIMRLAGSTPAEAHATADTVMRIETKLAELSMTKEQERDLKKTYNKKTLVELSRLAPSINWKRYFAKQAIPIPKEAVIMQPKFIKGADRLIATAPLEDLKAYLLWHLANGLARTLSPAFVKQSFSFYGTTLTGAKKMRAPWRRALASVNGNLGELLGRLYVNEHFSPAMKEEINEIVDDLFAAFRKRLRSLDWMSPATKKKALAKLRGMSRKLGYPDKWKSYRGLVIRPDDFFGNLLRAGEYEHRRVIRKLGRPVDWSEWFMHPQEVNAYYGPSMNDIAFPAAIMQFPFFDPRADAAVNYGAIGSVIGHEMTHGFDDQGAQFDAKGTMRNWWTKSDKRKFDAKGKVIERQFSAFEAVPGLNVNGKLTLGENIADLGGVSIALDAYRLRLERAGRKDIGGFTPEQRLFLGCAQMEAGLKRPEYAKFCALNDCHSPPEYRVNGPLSNMPEFYEAFGVKKGDKLYRSPAQRAKIW